MLLLSKYRWLIQVKWLIIENRTLKTTLKFLETQIPQIEALAISLKESSIKE